MAKPDSQETDKISLEELLEFKRLERPDSSYWERFDRELRAKPWQGMVRQPSLGQRLRSRAAVLGAFAVPAGAFTALALTVFWSAPVAPPPTGDASPAQVAAVDVVPSVEKEAAAVEPEKAAGPAEIAGDADPHFVVGSFTASDSSNDAFTTVAATHYMPATQRDGVHFVRNAIGQAAHQSMAMTTGPVRSFY